MFLLELFGCVGLQRLKTLTVLRDGGNCNQPQGHGTPQVTWIFINTFVCFWRDIPQWARASSFVRFLDHTQWRTTVGRTPLEEWSARRRDLYLTTHNTHNKHPSPPGGIRTHNLSRRAAADRRLRPRGRWDHTSLWDFFFWRFADRASQYIYLNINQLDALNFIMGLFHASTYFEHMCSSSGGQKLYYTTFGITTPIGGRPVQRLRNFTCSSSGGQNCTIQPLISSHL